MVRGRGYNSRGAGGGSGRGTYRSSGSYNSRMQSSRRPGNFGDSYGSSSSRYNSSYNNSSYESRNRDKFGSKYDSRPEKRYRDSSRDRNDDRKRSRQEDSRINSSYTSSSTPAAYRRGNDTSSRNHRAGSPPNSSSYRNSGTTSYRGRRDGSDNRRSDMGPPKRPIRSSLVVRPRGGGLSVRGLRGTTSSRGSGYRIVRRESADIRMMRKKLFYAQQKDRARLLKIAKLTSSLQRRKVSRRSGSKSPHKSRATGEKKDSDDDDEEDTDTNANESKTETKKKSKKIKDEKKSGDEEEIEEEDEEGVEKESGDEEDNDVSKMNTSSKKGEESSAEAEEDAETAAEGNDKEKEKGTPKKEGKKSATTAEGGEGEDGKKSKKRKRSRSKDRKTDEGHDEKKDKKDRRDHRSSHHDRSAASGKYSNFIKLTCPHCRFDYLTFKEYQTHLYSRSHKQAMRTISIRQKSHLQRLRQQQRNAQREIEEKSTEDLEELKPKFCLLCRLNYRQPKAKHQLSEHHKTMKKFLMPYCSSCHLAFKSPMLYEAHRCSLEHIKRKARNSGTDTEGSGNEMREIDLKKFMTVDSVGEIDDIEDESDAGAIDELEEEEDGKERLPVGAKFVKKSDAVYCELCRLYSAFVDDEETSIRKHCLTRSHLKAFIRHKASEDAKAKEQEVIENGEIKKADDSINEDASTGEKEGAPDGEEITNATAAEENEEHGEDKLWEDVDKDLGDLLREVGPEGQDEDDEEEDESVLNIDIESEKSKSKDIMNGKKEEPIVNNIKAKDDLPAAPVHATIAEENETSTETNTTASPTKPKPAARKEKTNAVRSVTVALSKKMPTTNSTATPSKATPTKTPSASGLKTPAKSIAQLKASKLAKTTAAAKAAAAAKADKDDKALDGEKVEA